MEEELFLLISYEKGKSIAGEYYANLLQRLSDEVKKERLHLAKNRKSCFTTHRHILQPFPRRKSMN